MTRVCTAFAGSQLLLWFCFVSFCLFDQQRALDSSDLYGDVWCCVFISGQGVDGGVVVHLRSGCGRWCCVFISGQGVDGGVVVVQVIRYCYQPSTSSSPATNCHRPQRNNEPASMQRGLGCRLQRNLVLPLMHWAIADGQRS